MKVNIPNERIDGYAQYQILNDDGGLIFAGYGPCSAAAVEIIFKVLEKEEKLPSPQDIFDRERRQRVDELNLSEEEKAAMILIGEKVRSNWADHRYIGVTGVSIETIDRLEALGLIQDVYIPFDDPEFKITVLGLGYLNII